MIEIKVPAIGESISEVTLLKWTKKDGDYVERDEVIAEFESEKATFEVNAEQAGVLTTLGKEGDTLLIGDVLAKIDETAQRPGGQCNAKPGQKRAGGEIIQHGCAHGGGGGRGRARDHGRGRGHARCHDHDRGHAGKAPRPPWCQGRKARGIPARWTPHAGCLRSRHGR